MEGGRRPPLFFQGEHHPNTLVVNMNTISTYFWLIQTRIYEIQVPTALFIDSIRLTRTPDKKYKSRRSLGVRINEVLVGCT